MCKDSSAKYYQNNKERLQKRLMMSKISKTKKKTSNNMVVNDTKIYQKMKNKRLLGIKKYYKIRNNALL